MFKAGDCVENPVTGERLLICKSELDTQGVYVEVEYFLKPLTGKNFSPRHLHPTWLERFEVLAGSARYELGHTVKSAVPGDSLELPPGVPHRHPWNGGPDELHVRQTTITPSPDAKGLRTAMTAIETLFRLADDGKVNRDGLPNPLQLAVLVYSMMPNTYLGDIPVPVQQPLFSILAAVGQAAGYQTSYPLGPLHDRN